MTRLLAFLLFALLVLAVTDSATRVSSHDVVHRVTAGSVPVVEPSPAAPVALPQQTVRSDRHRTPHCNNQHWRRSLTPAQRYIDWKESRLTTTATQPHTHAYGLGQLTPETYRILGLRMSPLPCDQIHAETVYEERHYGNWQNALEHWEANLWW